MKLKFFTVDVLALGINPKLFVTQNTETNHVICVFSNLKCTVLICWSQQKFFFASLALLLAIFLFRALPTGDRNVMKTLGKYFLIK